MCVIALPALGIAAGSMASAAATASLAASVIGAGMSAYGAIQQGQAARKQAEYQAAVSRNNALLAERQAQDAEQRGKVAEDAQREKIAGLLGTQRAMLAGTGFDLGDDTSASLLGDTAAAGELDALTIRNNAAREAYGYRTRGMNFNADADLSLARGRAAENAGYLSAAGTVLSSAGTVAGRWATMLDGGGSQYPGAYNGGTSFNRLSKLRGGGV